MREEVRYWRARCEVAERRALLFAELARELQRKFDPNQPRVPAGHGRESGRWTRDGGWTYPPDRSLGIGQGRGRFRPPPGGGTRVPRRGEAEAARTPTDEILAPGGSPVGYVHRGAGQEIRTVTRDEFLEVERQLRAGATRSSQPGYRGTEVWERPDGVRFGIRRSEGSGLTIDIFKTEGRSGPAVERIHQR